MALVAKAVKVATVVTAELVELVAVVEMVVAVMNGGVEPMVVMAVMVEMEDAGAVVVTAVPVVLAVMVEK